MPFANRIRLPLYLARPQWPATQNVFRLANGKLKVLSAVVRKTYEGETDYMPEAWHEKLRIALMHDNVAIEGQKMIGSVALEGEGYEVEWQRFLNYPTAKAAFTIQVGDYDFTNDNCQTCEEASQLSLVDDNMGAYDEGDTITGNVFTNDTIFCQPHTASITSINTAYVESADIDDDGNISIVLKATTPTMLGVWLATYRVTCPNGGYDEADVYADVTGSVPACQVPQNVADALPPSDVAHQISWDDSSPANGYEWQLYKESNLGLVFKSGTISAPPLNIDQLDPCTDYRFFIRAKCDDENVSEYAEITFSTDCPEVGCGFYALTYDNGFPDTESFTQVYYLDCANQQQVATIYNQQTLFRCLRESAVGVPVSVFGATVVTYTGTCQ